MRQWILHGNRNWIGVNEIVDSGRKGTGVMKKISLEQLLGESRADNYREQYQYVCGLIEKQKILPVKSSPLNGKKPALHQSYWLGGGFGL